ncbi:MAG: metallophosphoesterase [Spirochaetales bacterium]|nr:metallophosphoesterase [Spirochaetales bacterium]
MTEAVFVTDLHGKMPRYLSLFKYLRERPPEILFIGGDLLPPFMPGSDSLHHGDTDFIHNYLMANFLSLHKDLGDDYPKVVMIMGNDDPRYFESSLISAGNNLWVYLHQRKLNWNKYDLFGYSFVPPTPFYLKDWERYDVSRFTDLGCISPEEGRRSFPTSENDRKWTTIKDDLDSLALEMAPGSSIFLFHSPPYKTLLDKGDLKGQKIDHVLLDEHLGSIAIKRFIEERQPLLTLHGHIHESARMTGSWLEKIGSTVCINGSHDGDELSVIRLTLEQPEYAQRLLL